MPSFTSRDGRWQLCVLGTGNASGGLSHVSFVNNMATPRGGTHVSYVTDQLVAGLHTAIGKSHPELEMNQQLGAPATLSLSLSVL